MWSLEKGLDRSVHAFLRRLREISSSAIPNENRLGSFQREFHTALYLTYVRTLAYRSISDDEAGGSLQKIGLELGITRERVRQIRNHALDKLRRFLQRQTAGAVQAGHDLY